MDLSIGNDDPVAEAARMDDQVVQEQAVDIVAVKSGTVAASKAKEKSKKGKSKSILSFLSSEQSDMSVTDNVDTNKQIKTNPSSAKKRKLSSNENVAIYICIYKKCCKTITRGNESSRKRHLDTWHKGDKNFSKSKHILPKNHKDVVKLLKEKESEKKSTAPVASASEPCPSSRESSTITDARGLSPSVSINDNDEARIANITGVEFDNDVFSLDYVDESIIPNVVVQENMGAIENLGFEDDEGNIDMLSIEIEDSDADNGRILDNGENEDIAAKNIQSTIQFEKIDKFERRKECAAGKIPQTSAVSASDAQSGDNKSFNEEVIERLDFMMEKLSFRSNELDHTKDLFSEDRNAVTVLKKATNVLEIDGSGISFFPGKADGLVRCDSCFAMHCEKDPRLEGKDPFYLGHTNTSSSAGNTLALGLAIDPIRKQKLVEGHNDVWYRFKKTLIDHISCGSRKYGGDQHYQGIIARKHRNAKEKTIMQVATNQLKCTLATIKMKSAAMHYEDLISLLSSTGSVVGNLGHGRKQLNPMIKSFQIYMYRRLKEILTTPLPCTGLPPHFSTTSDKSTPIKVSNHAIMVLTVVDGEKVAIPICAPKVYDFKDNCLTGGTAPHLAEQVIDALTSNVKMSPGSLSSLVAHQADGQYQAREFLQTLKDMIHEITPPTHCEKYFVVTWDPSHWLDLILGDLRLKENDGEIFRRLVKRVNKFHHMFGSGKGHDEYQGYAKEHDLPSAKTKNYSTTRFGSSSFECFEKTYTNYEGMVKTYNSLRETADEEEETRYLIKGRDFAIDLCGIIDILSPFMEMMIRVQAMDQLIWTITIYMPKIRARLLAAKLLLEEQRINTAVNILPEDMFPKLAKHFSQLNQEDATTCTFQNVTLTEGWMVVNDNVDVDADVHKTKRKDKVFEWVDRSPDDCLEEMGSLIDTMIANIDMRLQNCVSSAAHSLGICLFVPYILKHIQGDSDKLSASQKVTLDMQGRQEFQEFFEYVCTLPHIQGLVEMDSNVMFLPRLANTVYAKFKEVIKSVVWKNLGNLRHIWFPPLSKQNRHRDEQITRFYIRNQPMELDDEYYFEYGNFVCVTKFDEKNVFRSVYNCEELYESLGKEMCTVLDIANGMSGSEAVVESFYSVMKTQTQTGGMNNDTLVERTIVDWCFPHPFRCEETIKEVAILYLHGDVSYGLSRHQIPVFVDERGRALRKYSHGSKVLDRFAREEIKTFAISPKDKI